jgi:diaminohydroxyphosphoribosylaminopyrimidine deaminase/5-amino-6-(5-phosphoribosylamino)uracil reductase
VNGSGIQRLKRAGIDVRVGVMEQACQQINEAYFKYVTQNKPFVTLKVAQTLDGKIATRTGLSKWITSEASRKRVHRMRNENDAILAGINTVITDNPELTVRHVRGHDARRIILDSRLRIPEESRVLSHPNPEKTIIVTTSQAPEDKIATLQGRGINTWICENEEKNIDLDKLWKKMADEGIASVLVEGGKAVFTSVLKSGEVDRIVVFIAPKVFGEGLPSFGNIGVNSPDHALSFKEFKWSKQGSDMVFDGRL